MESRIAPDLYLAAFLAILEDISVKICRGPKFAPNPSRTQAPITFALN